MPGERSVDPESVALVSFLADATKNVTKPMVVKRLCMEFKRKCESKLDINCLSSRIQNHCKQIHKCAYLDTNEKVKQLFALSAPVDSGYLKILRKDAVVEVDGQNCITKYNSKSLKLKRPQSLTSSDSDDLNITITQSGRVPKLRSFFDATLDFEAGNRRSRKDAVADVHRLNRTTKGTSKNLKLKRKRDSTPTTQTPTSSRSEDLNITITQSGRAPKIRQFFDETLDFEVGNRRLRDDVVVKVDRQKRKTKHKSGNLKLKRTASAPATSSSSKDLNITITQSGRVPKVRQFFDEKLDFEAASKPSKKRHIQQVKEKRDRPKKRQVEKRSKSGSIPVKSSEKSSATDQKSSRKTETSGKIEHSKVLQSFMAMLNTLNIPDLNAHGKILSSKIKLAERTGEIIPVKGVRLAFEAILRVSTRNVFLEMNEDTLFSLREFLPLLQKSAAEFDIPNFEGFKNDLDLAIGKIHEKNYYVLIVDLHKAFEMAIDIFSP